MNNGIDQETLQEWVDSQAPESQILEFKSLLPVRSEEAKHELLKDVSAMANADGGTIVFGISDKAGQAAGILPIIDESADAATRRLGQCIEAGIEPRISGVKFEAIRLAQGGYVLAVTVPRSFVGPHRVAFAEKNIFYLRSQTHIAQFSYSQLRDAFTLRAHAVDRIRAWRASRLMMIKAGRTPRRLWKQSRYVIHIFPIVSFADTTTIDIASMEGKGNELLFGRMSSYSTSFNLDGLVAASHIDQDHDQKYVQLFRNGALETVGFSGLLVDDQKIIPSQFIATELRSAVLVQLKTLIKLGITGPVAIAVSWLSVGDHQLSISNYACAPTDRDDLELPEVWADSIEDLSADVDRVVRPTLDILWQCFDSVACPLYDVEGKWNPS